MDLAASTRTTTQDLELPRRRHGMLLLILSLWALTALAGCSPWLQAEIPAPGAPSLDDPFYPSMGNGGYDALHYTLDLTVDVPSNTLAGTSTMRARPSSSR